MAGTVTQSIEAGRGSNIVQLTLTCTADAAAATIPDTALDSAFLDELARNGGWIYSVETWPGGTAPTDATDFTIENENGLDILGGQGTDSIDATSPLWFFPKNSDGGLAYYPITPNNSLTLKVTNNAVNSAVFYVRITGTLREVY